MVRAGAAERCFDMPLLRYFMFVGGALLALLFVCDAVLPQVPLPGNLTSGPYLPAVRIRSDRKWPERVVFDTSIPSVAPVKVAAAAAVPPAPPTAAEISAKARVRDAFAPWNDGHYELNGGPTDAVCERCTDDPDLELSAADLAAVYLGGNRFRTLHQAGRMQELHRGAVARADAMFATDRTPWCPSHF